MAKTKLTTQQLLKSIEQAKKKLAELNEDLSSRPADLNKDSENMQALLDAVQKVSDSNNVSVPDVIIAVARIKRTGLKIDKAERKARTKKSIEANN